MSLPTGPIRSAVKAELITRLRAAVRPVQVHEGWPGDRLERDAIWFAGSKGTVSIASMTAGRKYRDDEWTYTIVVQAGGVDAADAEARAEELYAKVDSVIADAPDLDEDIEGLIALGGSYTVDGPETYITKTEGAVSYYTIDLDGQARYH